MNRREKIFDAVIVIAAWIIAVVIAYAVYLKIKLLLN
jgi:hypothetical protein